MAKLPGAFNADDHDDMNDFSPVPADDYHLKIKDSKIKRNSNDTGDNLTFTFEIVEGEFKGRLLFANLCITHSSEKAMDMANKTLATICRACNTFVDDDTEVLHGCELSAKVVIIPKTAQYAAKNEIKYYSAIEGLAQPKAAAKSSGEGATVAKKQKVSFDD